MKLNKDITQYDILHTEQEIKNSLDRMNKNKLKENIQNTSVRTFSKFIVLASIIAIILISFIMIPVIRSALDYKTPIPATEKALEWVK